jgi:hypothetical protein
MGTGYKHALREFRTKVLPALQELTGAHTLVAWSNVHGNVLASDLTKNLAKQSLRYVGCHLFVEGRIVASRKVGWLVGLPADLVEAGRAVLEEGGLLESGHASSAGRA